MPRAQAARVPNPPPSTPATNLSVDKVLAQA
jgi:hypothetical protein